MKFFSPSEARLLKFLGVLLMIGLLAREIRGYLHRPSSTEQADRAAALQSFQAGSQAYWATGAGVPLALQIQAIGGPLDVNRATRDQLQLIGGIGPVLAKKIIDYRSKNGYFQTIQSLTNIRGIGPKLLARWDGLLTTQSDTTVQKGVSID